MLRSADLKNDFPIDPVLPQGFDNTPNDARSKAELDAWWDRPFAVTNKDGSFSVRCLHGGAWDRSSWLGEAATIDAARALGESKLAEWQHTRAEPRITFVDGTLRIIRMPQRPDQDEVLLGTASSQEEAKEFIKREFQPYIK